MPTTSLSSPPGRDSKWTWSRPQRKVIAVGMLGLLAFLGYRYLTNPVYMPADLSEEGPRTVELLSRLDPNVAPWEQMAILPGVGEKKAKAIIEYRERLLADRPEDVAFQCLQDLANVSGIGEATLSNLEPYLLFPSDNASEHDGGL